MKEYLHFISVMLYASSAIVLLMSMADDTLEESILLCIYLVLSAIFVRIYLE